MIPKTLSIDSIPIPVAGSGWSKPIEVPGCPGWTREFFPTPSTVAIRWTSDNTTMLDIKSRALDRLIEVDADGAGFFVRPIGGFGWSNQHPGPPPLLTGYGMIPESVGDPLLKKLAARSPIDHYLTHEGGSPREGAYDFVRRLWERELGLSIAGRDYLGAWVEAQLNRPYQDPDASGYPSGLTGIPHNPDKAAGASAWLGVPYWAPHCPCHLTVERLATAYAVTNSPRALDQLISLVIHALRSEYYLELEPDKFGRVGVNGFYASAPRMIGWPLVAISTTLSVLRIAAKRSASGMKLATLVGPGLKVFAEAHIANVLSRWKPGVWSPFETNDSTGGHSKEVHDVPFMHVPLIVGARRCAEFGVIGAQKLADISFRWIESYAVDQSAPGVAFYYDALKAGGGVGSRPVSNGVGTWFIAAIAGTNSDLEKRMLDEARATDRFGVPDIDWRNSLTPGLDWIPKGWV